MEQQPNIISCVFLKQNGQERIIDGAFSLRQNAVPPIEELIMNVYDSSHASSLFKIATFIAVASFLWLLAPPIFAEGPKPTSSFEDQLKLAEQGNAEAQFRGWIQVSHGSPGGPARL